MATHSSVLAWRILGTGEPGGLLSMGSHRVGQDWSDLAVAAAQDLLELTPQNNVLFIIGDWNAKVGSQEIPGITGKFGLGVQNEAGQRLLEFCQVNALVIEDSTHGHQQMVNTEIQIDYILCSQRWRSSIQSAKQDQELTVAQIMNSLLPNSD